MEIVRLLRTDRAAADGRVSIHLRCCWQGNKVRLSSGEKVRPADWDERRSVVRARVQFSADVNARLDVYERGLRHYAYQVQNAGQVLTVAMVQAEVERIRLEDLGQRVAVPLPTLPAGVPMLVNYLETYQKERPGGLSQSTAVQISAIRGHINAFMPGLGWSDLKVNTLNQLKHYFSEEVGLSDNTVSAYFGSFRGALKYATAMGYPVPADYVLVSGSPAEVIRPALNRDHLALLDAVTLAVPSVDYCVNWLFRMACYTGLRHSDLAQVRRSSVRIIDGYPCLIGLQQKATGIVGVPLVREAVELLDQHPDGFKPPGLWQYILTLRRIGQQAGLVEPVTVSSRYKGKLIHSVQPLYETLGSHTARRTFATLLLEGGINTKVLQGLMGHASITSTEKYARLPLATVRMQMLSAWHDPTRDPTSQK